MLQSQLWCQNYSNNHDGLIPVKIYPPVGQYRAGEMNSSFAYGTNKALKFSPSYDVDCIEIYESNIGSIAITNCVKFLMH